MRNVILIPIMLLILLSTAWSIYRSSERTPQAKQITTTTGPSDNFMENLYEQRLKEEGNRAPRVEKMIIDGKLSDRPARYWTEGKGEEK